MVGRKSLERFKCWWNTRTCQTCRQESLRRDWVDQLLAKQGWAAISVSNLEAFTTLRRQKALYAQIESSEAWKDYQFRLSQLREGTRTAIERGVVDAHGHTHEPEQRAVLYVVEQLMGYVPGIYRDYEQMLKALESDESLANAPVYGGDVMGNLTNEL